MGSDEDRNPRFSVVIPTCGRPKMLVQCLERLAEGEQTGANLVHRHSWVSERPEHGLGYEVIVSDDSPFPGIHSAVVESFPWVEVVQGPRRGPAANRNRGAREAGGRWLVFLDDDVLPQPGLLASYAAAEQVASEVPAGMEGAIHAVGPTDGDARDCPVNTSGGCFWSANIAVRRDLFERLGGFDERFRIAAQEDRDLYFRLKPHGQIPFVAGAIVEHPVKSLGWKALSVRDLLERKRAQALLETKHGPPLSLQRGLEVIARDMLLAGRISLAAAAKGRPLSTGRGLLQLGLGPFLLGGFLMRARGRTVEAGQSLVRR